jgi:hypothetical protein
VAAEAGFMAEAVAASTAAVRLAAEEDITAHRAADAHTRAGVPTRAAAADIRVRVAGIMAHTRDPLQVDAREMASPGLAHRARHITIRRAACRRTRGQRLPTAIGIRSAIQPEEVQIHRA